MFYLILFLFLIIYFLYRNNIYENFEFESESESEEKGGDSFDLYYTKLYEKVFNNKKLYEYDSQEIDKNAIQKYWKNKKIYILDAGCGVGRHYQYFAKKYSIVGIDRSANMLKYARIRNPRGKFKQGDLKNGKLFGHSKFYHIFCLTDSLYHNNVDGEMNEILANFYYWLKPNGILCLHIFDRKKLDPGPREFSQYYRDKNKKKHALTYFKNFSHDAWWEMDGDKMVKYFEKIITEDGNSRIRTTTLYIPKEKGIILDKLEYYGFKLVNIISLKPLDIEDFDLYIFKKKNYEGDIIRK